jgi:hypothetical protein
VAITGTRKTAWCPPRRHRAEEAALLPLFRVKRDYPVGDEVAQPGVCVAEGVEWCAGVDGADDFGQTA